MRWYDWTALVGVASFAVLVWAAMFGGLMNCSHRCYWCRVPLAPAMERTDQ
jgi:hypothetical protein